jgi:hypothetical protein
METTCYCGRLLVNADPEMQGMCSRCWKDYEKHCTPTLNWIDKAILSVLPTPTYRHINTRGPDPYAGSSYVFKVFGITIGLSNVISGVTVINGNQINWPESRFCTLRLSPSMVIQWLEENTVGRLGERIFDAFETEREVRSNHCDDFDDLMYYE